MNKKKAKAPPAPPKKRRGVRINHPDDVRRLLAKLINETLVDDTKANTLRAVSYACQTLLKVFELELIEKRIDRIEEAINAKKI
jgi:hypothetical protein